MGFSSPKTRYSELPSQGGLKPLAETSSSFSRVMTYSGTYQSLVKGAGLPGMYAQVQMPWCWNRADYHSRKQPLYRWRQARPCRGFVIRALFRRDKRG